MKPREKVLEAIRRSLGRDGPLSTAEIAELRKRDPSPVQPGIESDLTARFAAKLELAGGSVERVESIDEVAPAIGRYLRDHQLPGDLVVSADPVVSSIDWPPMLEVDNQAVLRDRSMTKPVSPRAVMAALPESGHPDAHIRRERTPTTLNFLPDHHIVVLPESRTGEAPSGGRLAPPCVGHPPRCHADGEPDLRARVRQLMWSRHCNSVRTAPTVSARHRG